MGAGGRWSYHFIWKQQAALCHSFSCKLFQKAIGNVSGVCMPSLQSRGSDALPQSSCCWRTELGFHCTDPAVLAKRGGTCCVRKPTGCFFTFWVSLCQLACTVSEPDEMDQNPNKTEPLGCAWFFPLLPAAYGPISAMRPSWRRGAVHDFKGIFERLELSQCLLGCWRSPSDGLGLC